MVWFHLKERTKTTIFLISFHLKCEENLEELFIVETDKRKYMGLYTQKRLRYCRNEIECLIDFYSLSTLYIRNTCNLMIVVCSFSVEGREKKEATS